MVVNVCLENFKILTQILRVGLFPGQNRWVRLEEMLAAIKSCSVSDNVGEHPLPLKQSTAFPVWLFLEETAAVCVLLPGS